MPSLDFKANGVDSVITQVNAALAKHNSSVKELVGTYVTLNKAGKLLSGVFTSIAPDGKKIDVFVNSVKQIDAATGKATKSLKVTGTAAKDTTDQLTKLAAAQKLAAGMADVKFARATIQKQVSVDPRITNIQRGRLDSLMEQSLSNVGKGTVTSAEFKNIFDLMKAGSKQTYGAINADLERTRQQIVRVIKEQDRLNASLKAAPKANSFAAQVPSAILKRMGPLDANARQGADTRIIDSTRQIQELMNKSNGALSFGRVRKIMDETLAHSGKIFTGIEGQAQRATQRIISEYERAANAGKKLASAQNVSMRRGQMGDLAGNKIAGAFDFSKLDTKGLNSVYNEVARIQKLFDKGFTNLSFKAVFNDILTGAQKNFKGAENVAAQSLAKIKAMTEKATAASFAQTIEKKQGIRRGLESEKAGTALTNQFDLSKLAGNPRNLEQAYAQISKIKQLLSSGAINGAQFRDGFKAFTQGGQAANAGAEQVRAAMKKIDIAMDTSGQSLKRYSAGFSFFKAQIMADFVYGAVGQFKTVANEAAQFAKEIALLQTISQDAKASFGDWTDEVLKVSNKLGESTGNVSAAGYDLLSNQITKGPGDTGAFLETTGDFARTTNSKLEDSVNLFSSAINAFRMSAADGEQIAAQFFTAIDKGRIKASDLANTFGRVATTAKGLGDSLPQTLALLTTITRVGIAPDTAQTLLTNVYQKMIRPTDELKSVFKDSTGSESGEVFVKTYGGVAGALEKLGQIAGGSKTKLAEFFNEIRSFQGGNILIDRLDEVMEDYKEMMGAMDAPEYDKAKDLTKDNYGQRFTEETNKITNFFKEAWETKVLKVVIDLTDKFGGLANIVEKMSVPVLAVAVSMTGLFAIGKFSAMFGGISGVSSVIAAISLSIKGVGAALLVLAANPLTWVLVAAVGVGVLTAKVIAMRAAWAKVPKEIERTTEAMKVQMLLDSDKKANEQKKTFDKTIDTQQLAGLGVLAQTAGDLNKVREAQKAAASELKDGLNVELEQTRDAAKKAGSAYEAAMTKARDAAKDAAKAMRDLNGDAYNRASDRASKINDRNMNNARTVARLNNQDPELAANSVDRSGEIYDNKMRALQARKQKAFEMGDVGELSSVFKEINSLMDEMAGKTMKIPFLNGRGESIGEYLEVPAFNIPEEAMTAEYNDQLALLDRIHSKKQAEAALAERNLAAVNKMVDALEKVSKSISNFNPFDKEGHLDKQYKDAGAALDDLMAKQERYAALLKSTAGIDVPKSLQEKFDQQKQGVKDGADTDAQQQAVQAAQESVTNAVDVAKRGMDASIKLLHDAADGFGDAQKKLTATVMQLQAAEKHNKPWIDTSQFSTVPFDKRPKTTGQKADAALKGMEAANKAGDVEALRAKVAELRNIYQQANQLNNEAKAAIGDQPAQTVGQMLDDVQAQITAFEVEGGLMKKAEAVVANKVSELGTTGATIEALVSKFGGASSAATGYADTVAGVASSTAESTAAMVSSINAVTAAWNAMKAAKDAANSGESATSVKAKRLGGMVYANDGFMADFASGAYARGSDTLPIMANRNEMIINAESTKNFYPQLQAINRGQDPTPRGNTGGNTTINLGGLNITGGKTNKATANEIVSSINRASRRGNMKVK